jgi:hypothetical protein
MRGWKFILCAIVAAGLAWAAVPGALPVAPAAAQFADRDVTARERLFPEVGAGVRAIKRDPAGRYLVLVARGPLYIFGADGARLGQIAAPPAEGAAGPLGYGDDFDLDAAGRIYIADRAANAVKIFSPGGALESSISAPAPNSVAVLAEGEIAVTSASLGAAGAPLPRLVSVYDARGRQVRQFGDPVELADRRPVNRLLGFGRIQADASSHIYYAFSFLPEPSLRKFDRFGYGMLEIKLATLEFLPAAQAARREIQRQDDRGGSPQLKPTLTAMGIESATEEIWLGIANQLLHFDREGTRRGSYRVYSSEGVRLEPVAILVEPERLLLACDPLGVFVLPRPDRPQP